MPRKAIPTLPKHEQKSLRSHLRRVGRWDEFVKIREALKDRDMPGAAAWIHASEQIGWIRHEGEIRNHLKGYACVECDSEATAPNDSPDSNSAGHGAASPCDAGLPPASIDRGPEKKPTFLAKSKLEMMPKEMAAEKPRQEITADVEWVTENLGVSGLKPEDAPSSRAWSWYIQALYDNNAYRMVMDHSKKLMPTGKQLERESKHGNLGTKRLAEFETYLDSEECARLLAADAVQQQGAEIAPTERVISQADLAIR